MYLEESKISRFLGTGDVNADGDNLSAFLKKYNPNKYQNPSNTVDVLIFTYIEEDGIKRLSRLLLIKRSNHPSIGWWALPGGFVEYREDIDKAALRELKEETGIDGVDICQLKCYGSYDRDPRTRIITTAYVALVPEGSVEAKAGDDAGDSGWFDISDEMEDCAAGIHRLTLIQSETKLELWARVEVKRRMASILPQSEYRVIESERLAGDHGAIILEGYHYVTRFLGV